MVVKPHNSFIPVEIKSAATPNKDFEKNLKLFNKLLEDKKQNALSNFIVYSGELEFKPKKAESFSLSYINFKNIAENI